MSTVECAGCGKRLEDSYKERAIYTVALADYKVCPGRRSYMGEPDPAAACVQKLLRKHAATCYGCGETACVKQGQVCAECRKKIARGNEIEKPVQWIGFDPGRFFTRQYAGDLESAEEALRLLARAVKGARRMGDRPDEPYFNSTKLGGEHPKVYVEVDEDQLEALSQLQKSLARVGDEIERQGVKEGSNLLGRLARGSASPDDFEQWESKRKPMSQFRSLLLEYRERGLDDAALTKSLGALSNELHYWRTGESEPSRAMQEAVIAFASKKIAKSKE